MDSRPGGALASQLVRENQAAGIVPRGPGFSLRLLEGRALLSAVGLDLEGLPDVPAGMTAQLLTLEIPHVRFPLEASGGAERFRHRRLQLRTLDLEVPWRALLAFAPRALCGLPVVGVALEHHRGLLRARLTVEAPGGPEDVVLDLALVAAPPTGLDVVVTRVAWLGAHGVALEVVDALQEALGATRLGALTLRVDALGPLLTRVLVCHGWKAPSLQRVEDLQVAVGETGLRVRALSEAAGDRASAPAFPEALARAAAANAVLPAPGKGPAAARALDRAASHPLALALMVDALAQESTARAEVEAALAQARTRFPADVDVLLAQARVTPHQPAGWRALLAVVEGDAALTHGAAWWLGRTAGSLEALQQAADARPDHGATLVSLARLAADRQQWTAAATAARAALELELTAAQEATAATALGEARLAQGDLGAARQALLRAQRQGPVAAAALALGRVLTAEKRAAEAVHHLTRTAEQLGDDAGKRALWAQAALLTQEDLKDAAGALALWRRVMTPGAPVDGWRGAAARAAWLAGDAELTAQWALGAGNTLPRDRVASLFGGLALARLGGQAVRARLLLEHAGEDASLRDEAWKRALEGLEAISQPLPPEGGTALTSAVQLPTHEDAPLPGENIHETLPEDEPTELRRSPFAGFTDPQAAPLSLPPRQLPDADALAAMEPVEAATVFLQAYDAPGAPRELLVAVLDVLMEQAPDRALAVMEELQGRDPLPLPRWMMLARHARQLGQGRVEMAALEVQRTASPEGAREALLRQVEILRGLDQAQEALARLLPQAMEQGGVLALRAAELAEELDQPEVALAVLGAAEARTVGADGLAWARRARTTASLAGRHEEAVAAARRAARWGGAEDQDALEEALEAAGQLDALAGALWDRAMGELDMERALRAARLEMGGAGGGPVAALGGLQRVLAAGAVATPGLVGVLEDVARATPHARDKAAALMLLVGSTGLPHTARMAAASELESMALPEDLALQAEETILASFPDHAPALARTARRNSVLDPARATRAAIALVDALTQRGAPAMERLTWLQFAAAHAQRAGDAHEAKAVEALLEVARREPEAAKAARVDRRALLMRLATLYEVHGQPAEAVRVLSHAELLDGPPDSRAAVFKRIATLEEERLQRPERAVEALEHAVRAAPDDEDALKRLARALETAGRLADAANLHAQAAGHQEGPRRAAHLLAAADMAAREVDGHARAVALCREALRAAPSSDAPVRRLVELHRRGATASLVRTLLLMARLRGGPASGQALEDAGALLVGMMGRPRLAAAVFRRAAQVRPTSQTAWRALAELHRANGRMEEVAEALGHLALVTEDPAARAQAELARAEVLSKDLARDEDAWGALQAALLDAPNLPGVAALGQQLADRLGRPGDLEKFARMRTQAAPTTTLAQSVGLEAARSLIRLGDVPAALRMARAAVDARWDNPTAWNALRDAAVLAQDQDTQREATAALVELLREKQPSLAAQEAQRLARLCREAGRPLDTVKAYTTALELAPDTQGLAFGLGEALLEAGDAPEAWARLSRLEPSASRVSDEEFARVLARAASEAGVFEETDAWERVTALAPRDPTAWQRLGTAAEHSGAWSRAAQAWRTAADLSAPRERARLLRRAARASADAGQHTVAADTLEDARRVEAGPAAEHVLLARWRLNAGQLDEAAAALRAAREADADVPEDILAEAAVRLHQASRMADARTLLGLAREVTSVSLARAVLELAPDTLDPTQRAQLHERMAQAATTPQARAALLDHAAAQWWNVGEKARAVEAAQRALEQEETQVRLATVLTWAVEGAPLEPDALQALAARVDQGTAAVVGTMAARQGALAMLPDVVVQLWATMPDAPASALQELARRGRTLPPVQQLEVLSSVVDRAQDAQDASTVGAGDEAARALADMFAGQQDFEAARAWSLRLREPAVEDLRQRLRWLLELERWREALDTATRLAPRLPADEEAQLREQAVEMARDRLEDPQAALPHCRRWVDLKPDHRPARAALVELLEETQAWAQAAQEVAAWARRGSGVESQALWRKALQLAVDSQDNAVRVDVARQAHGAVPNVEHLRALVEALREAGDLEALGTVLASHANETGEQDDVWGAVDAWRSSGNVAGAAALALKHFPTLLPAHQEERFQQLLVDAGMARALADRLRETLTQDDSGLAHARFLRRMPRALTTPMEVARVTVALAGREQAPQRYVEAAAAQLAVGDVPGAWESVEKARSLGAHPVALAQLERALAVPVTQPPPPPELAWVTGAPLPEDVGDLEAMPSWLLTRLEAAAAADGRISVATAALDVLAARGQALDAHGVRARSWLGDPDATPWLSTQVHRHPQLLTAALELLVEQRGAQAAVEFAVQEAQGHREDGPAAAAWEAAAALSAEAMDDDAERAHMSRAWRRQPTVGRARRVLELARRAQDVPTQLEALEALARLDQGRAQEWGQERGNLLLEMGELEEAAQAFGAAQAPAASWERLYRLATLSGKVALQRAALEPLAVTAEDQLALAALLLQQGQLDGCQAWLESARRAGLEKEAAQWLEVELFTARHDEDALRGVLTALARAGGEEATRRLTDLGGAEVDARLDALEALLEDGQGPAVAAELRRLMARGESTRARVAQRVRAWCEPLGAFPKALQRAVDALMPDEHDLPVAALLGELASALGFPEMARRAFEVQSQGAGPQRAQALRALATMARRAGRLDEERDALAMLLLGTPDDAAAHARLGEQLEPPTRFSHQLIVAQLSHNRRERLESLLKDAARAQDATWSFQVASALLGASGNLDARAMQAPLAQRLVSASAAGFPAALLLPVLDQVRQDGAEHLVIPALENALAHGVVDALSAHRELVDLHQRARRPAPAFHHAQQVSRLAPEDITAAQRQLALAREAGAQEALLPSLLHLASLLSGLERANHLAEAVDLMLEAGDHARALGVLKDAGVDDPRLLARMVEVARAQGDRVALATALEQQLGAASTMAERASLALEVADAWKAAGDPTRALGAAISQAGRSLAACEAIREAALQRGETGTALAVVRARWSNAGGQERRALVHHWMRVWGRLDAAQQKDHLDATRDLMLMQSTADPEDGVTLLWLARDAETARRWELCGQRWLQLATLSSQVTLPQDVVTALQTHGVSVLARTGSLDEAERLAQARLQVDAADRGALEVLLASARGRADAQEVVRLLSGMARASQIPEEKAFIWREAADWMAGPLLDAAGAVTALRAAHAIKPLNAQEAQQLARLAGQAGDVAAELEALELSAAADGPARVQTALRRAELLERRDAAPQDVLEVLRDALQHPESRAAATQRVAELALRTGTAATALGWVTAVGAPTARREATRYWQARALLAEAANAASEAIKAHAELATLGEPHAAARVAHWLGQSGQPAQAARAWMDGASRETQPDVRAQLLREAIKAWEAAGDAAAADDARLQLLEVDARDMDAFDAVELRLRRQGKVNRLPPLALRVAQAQTDHPARARMFERAAVLLRDVAGDEAAAAAAFGSAVESDPFRASCLLALADLAFRRNSLEEAAQWFSQVPDSADAAWPDVPAAETAYRRGVCLESTGGDGRVALRRCLELDPAHAAARAALSQAAERHGDPLEAARTLMGAQDAPNPESEPRAYATWMLKQAHALQTAGQHAASLALLESAHAALPGNPGLLRALAVARQEADPAAAAALFRRVSQLSSSPQDRAAALQDEARAWTAAQQGARAADALVLAAQQDPQDPTLLRAALEAAATADAQVQLVQLSPLLEALPTPLELTPELHLALAQALSQDKRAPVAALLRHANGALAGGDTWRTRLLAVGAARRAQDHAALVTHVEAALPNCPEPGMGAMLAAEAARAALMELKDVARGVALVRTAHTMGGQDAKVRARLAEIFPEPLEDTSVAQAAVRDLLEDGSDMALGYQWLERVAAHQRDQRHVVLCREAAALLGNGQPPQLAAAPLRAEASRAIMLHKDADWLATSEFPARLTRLVAGWSKEIHGVVQRGEIHSRSLSGDEARKLATDIRFARSLVDGTLPVVITDQPGAHIGGLVGPHLVLGPDVVRATEPVRRAVLAVGFATVRWGLEPSVLLPPRDLQDLFRALTGLVTLEQAAAPRAREMQQALEKSLKGRWPAGDTEAANARTALEDGRLPTAEEARRLLCRVAFLAAGTLGHTVDALDRIAWLDAKAPPRTPWSRAVLRWACAEEGVEARARLGLEELDV